MDADPAIPLHTRLRRLHRHPRLVVGVAAILVALPYLTGVYGPTELEVHLWGVVILGVGVGITPLDGDPSAAGWRRNPIRHIAALVVLGFATLFTVSLAESGWYPFMLAPLAMLVIALILLAGRTWFSPAATHALAAALALLVAAAQYPAIWAWFHFSRLGDMPDPTPFITHWAYSLPHFVLGALALWLAGAEVAALRASFGGSPAEVGTHVS